MKKILILLISILVISLVSTSFVEASSVDVNIYEEDNKLHCEAPDMSIFAATGWRWFEEDNGDWEVVEEDKTRDINDPHPNTEYEPSNSGNFRCEVYAGDTNWDNFNEEGFAELEFDHPDTPDPIDGVCGIEDGNVYDYDDSDWETNDFCEVGDVDPSDPSFPEAGDETVWSCLGENDGDDVSCSASREDAPDGALTGIVDDLTLTCNSDYSYWATTGWRWFEEVNGEWEVISEEKERKTSTTITVDEPGDYKCAIYFGDENWYDFNEGDSLILTATEPRPNIEILSIDYIGDLRSGSEVIFTSDVINYDEETVNFEWFINNEQKHSNDNEFSHVFEESGEYEIRLDVEDEFSSDTKSMDVVIDESYLSVDVSYYSHVIEGNDQVLSFLITDQDGEYVSDALVEVDGDRSNDCTTSDSGGCNIVIPEDDEGEVNLNYVVSKDSFDNVYGEISYDVLEKRYEIIDLMTYNDSDYSVESSDFFRGDSLYLSFRVWDLIEEEYIIPDVSEAYLVGDGDREELDFDGTVDDYLRFNTDVPLTDHFLGESFSVVFAFDLDYSYGGQEEIEVFLNNNPPFLLSDLDDITMNFGSTKSIDLDNYFRDREDNALGYDLSYDFSGCSNQDVEVDGSYLLIEALTVEDCDLEVTAYDRNDASVSSSFTLSVIEDSFDLDVTYFSRVIVDNYQTVTFSAESDGEPLSDVEVSLSGLDSDKTCTTDSYGGCNIKYLVEDEGEYRLNYEADHPGFEMISGSINYEVIPKRYEILDLMTYNDSDYSVESNKFSLKDDFFISFRVWDLLEEEYTIPDISEAYLVGDGIREELDFDGTVDDYLRFNTTIPDNNKFLGESFSIVFAFDSDYKYGGQREIPIYIRDDRRDLNIISPQSGDKIDRNEFDLVYELKSEYRIPKLDFYLYKEDNLVDQKTFSGINGRDSTSIELSRDYLDSNYQNFTIVLSLRGHDHINDSVDVQIRDEIQKRLEESRKQNVRITRARPEILGDQICVNLASHTPMKSRTEVTFSIRELGLRHRNVVRSGSLDSYCFDFYGYDVSDLRGETLRISIKNRGDHEVIHRTI